MLRRSSGAAQRRQTLESQELSLWDKWVADKKPDVFGFLEFAEDAGFSEVTELYQTSRWITAIVLVVFVFYNVYFVISLDVSLVWDAKEAAEKLGTTIDQIYIEEFYLSKGLIQYVARKFGFEKIPSSVQIIGVLELGGLVYFISELILCIFLAASKQGFQRWQAIYTIFWSTLPSLSVYSAMRLLYHIVPIVLMSKANELIMALVEAKSEGKRTHINDIIVWLLKVVFGFIVGFDTFLMKLRLVSASVRNPNITIRGVFVSLQFLVQLLGVVQLGTFVRRRLFLFIFGGEDAIFQDEEIVLMETWQALLTRRMYIDLPFYQFIAVMASFSDEDFQKLVLNEKADGKKELGTQKPQSRNF